MSRRAGAALSIIIGMLFPATRSFGECLWPDRVNADIGCWISKPRYAVNAPTLIEIFEYNVICDNFTVKGDLKIIQENPELHFNTSISGIGTMAYTHEAPAAEGKCYRAEATAKGGTVWPPLTHSASAGPACWEPPCPDTNMNGICDSLESTGPDPNDDSCPGGPPCTSPLILNLGEGPYRLSGVDDPVNFDINADGIPNRITWTARDSAMAFLAIDRNGDGVIDRGSELFGNWSTLASGARASNGFDALRELDTNSDGLVNSLDRAWGGLLLWTDADHDGVSRPVELQRIDGSAVEAVATNYHWTGRRDPHGNFLGYEGLAHLDSGRRALYDVFFRTVP